MSETTRDMRLNDRYYSRKLISKEDEYTGKKRLREYSPERKHHANPNARSYADTLHSTSQTTRRASRWDSDSPKTSPKLQEDTSVYSKVTPESLQMFRLAKELEERNRPLTDQELNALLPLEGYEILTPPEDYKPPKPANALVNPLYNYMEFEHLPEELSKPHFIPGAPTTGITAFPPIKPEDLGYFGDLLKEVDFDSLSYEAQKERRVMELLLKVKNGDALVRKMALRQIAEHARELGPGPLFSQILPLMMSPTLEAHERHQLVKVIDRVLYKLDALVRPYVHKILVVVMPMLIEEDFYARVEGREVISSLAKAAGFPTMISTMRPDLDHEEEHMRNITARSFAVVASALGIPTMAPFLRAVIASKNWVVKHTGIKIVQQIAILIGYAVLPHLKNLVQLTEGSLRDENSKVRTITALALAALAESSFPYGIEAFEEALTPLLEGIRRHKGRTLAAFLKAMGCVVVLMDTDHALACCKKVSTVLLREFDSNDDDMRRIVMKVIRQVASVVPANYVRDVFLGHFFKAFWDRRVALDKRNSRELVESTVEIAKKIGGAEVIGYISQDLKDESEPYRCMVVETIEKVALNLGLADVSSKLVDRLLDGLLFCFQEQTEDSSTIIDGFGTVATRLGIRSKHFVSQICGTIQWRLNNRSPRIRMQASDLISKVAGMMKDCGEDVLLGRMGVVLFESLGEEYPDVLGSIIGALKAIVNVIGMSKMTPPIKDLLPRLTPILKNRHEKVQENVIDLIGRIAERKHDQVSAKEWMRICFDLLELLRAHKKAIRRATISTFGFISKAIGPHDVLSTLLSNLKVQERQNRVCTTVAIAIVSESCGPFTVIPALMNEYRVPEVNVQNGVLKSFSFMFEHIGEMTKDYIYAVTPLLEDALIDRDLIHRQIACSSIKNLALGVYGLGCEDALTHLLNFVWANIFETSPHFINSVIDAIDGLRVSLGVGRVLTYVTQGLFHPARKVREVYWRIYNLLYLGGQDALVMSYPELPDDSENSYRRHELELFL